MWRSVCTHFVPVYERPSLQFCRQASPYRLACVRNYVAFVSPRGDFDYAFGYLAPPPSLYIYLGRSSLTLWRSLAGLYMYLPHLMPAANGDVPVVTIFTPTPLVACC
ncbi:hypothetical protein CRM22_002631 [Opisthorchis felineus]|uniref:Uncharacterized protein n=1 Tax=Opisthorchis felineus TaxID=147828 RepID=A0A4S2M9L0_OPIFE|nr:hypothetical protein CRM22_002631 [Opisthorchis felineus]